jgi:lactoylglutathione lyase
MAQHALTIVYVDDVAGSLKFFEDVLGSKCAYKDEEVRYAQLAGDGTNLAFVDTKMMKDAMGAGWKADKPDGFELTFVTDDVDGLLAKAIAAGAILVKEPMEAFWSKRVAYVKSPQGILIELCLPLGG